MTKLPIVCAVLAALICASTAAAEGQTKPVVLEITPFIGYQFGGGVSVTGGAVNIKDAPNLGLYVDYKLGHDLQLEFAWSKQETELRFRQDPFGAESTLFGATASYYHIGALYVLKRGGVVPFATMTAGVTHFDPKTEQVGSEWNFSLGLAAGVKIFMPRGLGLRLQGRLLLSPLSSGTGIWCGTGGCGVGISGSGIGQGDVNAGLVFSL